MSGAVAGLIQASNRFGIAHSTWSTSVSSTAPGHYDGFNAWSLSNGNLTSGVTTSPGNASSITSNGSMGVGKWYFEITIVTATGNPTIGVIKSGAALTTTPGANSTDYAYTASNGNKVNNAVSSAYGSSFTAGDVVGVAFDNVNGIIWFSKNGTWQATATITEVQNATTTHAAYTGISAGIYYAGFGPSSSSSAVSATANFGGTNFAQTCPTGFTGLY